MEDYEQKSICSILIDNIEEQKINRILNCISERSFPAVITYKKNKAKFNVKNTSYDEIELHNITQSMNIYKTITVLYYLLSIVDRKTQGLNIEIKEMIEYFEDIINTNSQIDDEKNRILKEIIYSNNKEEKKLLSLKYKNLNNKLKTVDYNKLISFYAFSLLCINKDIIENYKINISIDENVNNPFLNKAIKIMSKYFDVNVDIKEKSNNKVLNKKLQLK